MPDVTQLLQAMDAGDPKAADQLLPLVYEELRRLAAAKMAQEKPGQTLQATALVHEAWIRLAGDEPRRWDNRRHFFAAAAESMRRILVAKARRRLRVRHGGGLERVNLDEVEIPGGAREEQLVAVDEALSRLELEDPGKAELVKLRYFVGLNNREVSEALGVSEATVERHWSFAKAWLFTQIKASR
ncbi:MAG: sigma-70 family RNA polymerase sigma factor [Verrucomicrobiota bacterium]